MLKVKTKKQNRAMIVEMTLTAVLAALILLLTFCNIAYIPMPYGISVTFISLPVAIGSVVLGYRSGIILGAVFGLSSFYTCFGLDALGVILLGINPILTALMCFIPRILCGFLPALIYKVVDKKNEKLSIPIASAITTATNSVLFLSSMWIFFGKSYPGVLAIIPLCAINAVIEMAVCVIVGTTISKALLKVKSKFII